MPRKKKEGPPPVDGCEECDNSLKTILNLDLGLRCSKHGLTPISVSGLFHQAGMLHQGVSDTKQYQMGRHALATLLLRQIAGPGNSSLEAVANELIRVMKEAQRIIDEPDKTTEAA